MSQATEMFFDFVRVETRLYNTADARLRDRHGLTLGQFQLLHIIDSTENCRVLDVVQAIGITVGAASKAVDRVEAAGLCARAANPGDRRSSILTLTPEGAEQLKTARPVLERELTALTADVAPLDELARAAGVLAALRASLEKLG
ncbi:MarR family winged helix-turn-helix transcriptional regulator [Kineosporia succinea]|uniref:DNA-binding MarR family transcriptional regulator n=1 Tax=Kineosporia succinea TaxID=84632 RepID=A0ABT9P8A1_9ACTN|nr:MarR family transcriptional regulator [Kineosporia succinea]MDP9828921.1 DNA-binding MarR family transcriptional regulator [Kineosporia succinea]